MKPHAIILVQKLIQVFNIFMVEESFGHGLPPQLSKIITIHLNCVMRRFVEIFEFSLNLAIKN